MVTAASHHLVEGAGVKGWNVVEQNSVFRSSIPCLNYSNGTVSRFFFFSPSEIPM